MGSRRHRWALGSLLTALAIGAAVIPAAPADELPPPADLSVLFPNLSRTVTDPHGAKAHSQIANALIDPPVENLVAPPRNPCETNTEDRLIRVSLTEQHAWMCEKSTLVHETPATTGAADLEMGTPTGTWRVLSKEPDRFLAGADYYLHVDYWLQYDGEFGIHDSAWQQIPYGSPDYRTLGSHGCVHFPAASMAWTFEWSQLETTTVTIEP